MQQGKPKTVTKPKAKKVKNPVYKKRQRPKIRLRPEDAPPEPFAPIIEPIQPVERNVKFNEEPEIHELESDSWSDEEYDSADDVIEGDNDVTDDDEEDEEELSGLYDVFNKIEKSKNEENENSSSDFENTDANDRNIETETETKKKTTQDEENEDGISEEEAEETVEEAGRRRDVIDGDEEIGDEIISDDVIIPNLEERRGSDDSVFLRDGDSPQILVIANENEISESRKTSQQSLRRNSPATPDLGEKLLHKRPQSAAPKLQQEFWQKLHAYDNRAKYDNWERQRRPQTTADRRRRPPEPLKSKRPRSCLPANQPSTKELRKYLPRLSFFDCHDVTLKEAGYDLNEYTKSKRKSVVNRQCELTQPRSDSRFERRASIHGSAMLRRISTPKKSSTPLSEKNSVDCKPVLSYVHAVNANKPERKRSFRGCANLVKLGLIFTNRQNANEKESKIEEAVNKLNSRTFNASGVSAYNSRRTLSRRSSNATSIGSDQGTQLPNEENELKKVEEWLNNLPTSQIIKAKERAFRELTGDGTGDLERQLTMIRKCRYIRTVGEPIDGRYEDWPLHGPLVDL